MGGRGNVTILYLKVTPSFCPVRKIDADKDGNKKSVRVVNEGY